MANKIQRKSKGIDLDASEIEEIFEQAFTKTVENPKNGINIESFDVSASKENLGKDVVVEVTVCGLAGTTTRTQFQDKKTKKTIKGGDKIEATLGAGREGKAIFKLDHIADLNTNDYRLYYKLEV